MKKKFLSAIERCSPWKRCGSEPAGRGDRRTVTGRRLPVQKESLPFGSSPREEKTRLRAQLRAARRALPAAALAQAAASVATLAAGCGAIARARSLAGYLACDGEIDVAAVLAAARARDATIVLPRRTRAGGLELVVTPAGAVLEPRRPGGILEPTGSSCDPAALPAPAVLLAPAVALDRRGHRLGRGGGDYDRLIPRLRALGWTIVGVCHAASVLDALPVEPHDERVDLLLTDAGLATVA
ncbi:MAG: 5-formyltetrahydrofolate cyclo-ligase [Thermodesulfobacteriota bacterium]